MTRMLVVPFLLTMMLLGAATATAGEEGAYTAKPGDVLAVTVWKEPDLQREVLVRPDGGFSFPLAGEIDASGRSIPEIQEALAERIARYIPEPVVTVALREIQGNKIYVLGKVNRPGPFVMTDEVDVMKALSLAGGTSTFAALDDIKVLRREGGSQQAIPFHYDEVASGENLEQNIILKSGDVVVVP